jgi:hypothetical protein
MLLVDDGTEYIWEGSGKNITKEISDQRLH